MPALGIEPRTAALQVQRSTPELYRRMPRLSLKHTPHQPKYGSRLLIKVRGGAKEQGRGMRRSTTGSGSIRRVQAIHWATGSRRSEQEEQRNVSFISCVSMGLVTKRPKVRGNYPRRRAIQNCVQRKCLVT